ncbi:MAG: cell wall-binding repeat-containing protein [Actinomycetota bacterium]|nr:cell wall-binding repeat-containing protein [Actinomycetota bacterium]
MQGSGSRRRSALSFLLVMAMCLALVPIAPAAAISPPAPPTVFVDPVAGDDANGGLSATDAFETLGAAVDAAMSGGEIVMLPGMYDQEEFPVTVDKDLAFTGQDGADETIVTSADVAGLFRVTESSASFEGITFTDSYNQMAPGGAMTIEFSDVTLTSCVFTRNSTPVGGAVFSINSSLGIFDCVFDQNGDETGGFGIGAADILDRECFVGGAVYAAGGSLDISDSTFTANGAYEAAPAVYAEGVEATVYDTTFDGNQVTLWLVGPERAPQGESAPFDVEGVSAQGPGMRQDSGALTLFDSAADVSGCTFSNNLAFNGGGIAAENSSVQIDTSQFVDNITFTGAVAFGGDMLLNSPPASQYENYEIAPSLASSSVEALMSVPNVIDRCLFTGTFGGGTVLGYTGETGTVKNSLFVHNGTAGDGPDLASIIGVAPSFLITPRLTEPGVSDLAVLNCTIADNSAVIGIDALDSPMDVLNTIVWNGMGLDSVATSGMIMGCALETGLVLADTAPATPAFVSSYFSEEPEFVDPEMGDYRLMSFSPCIDTGTDVVSDRVTEDYVGAMRPIDGDDDSVAQFDVGAFEYDPWNYARFGGADRYDTSVQVSQRHFPDGADTVVLATGLKFADGLAAAGLAGSLDAPILLADPEVLPDVVAEEIVRLGAGRVVIVGGPEAVSEDVADEVATLGELVVDRIGGLDRYDTAGMIAEEIIAIAEDGDGFGGTFFIARGDLFADALTASPVAYSNQIPILLVAPDELPEATVDVIQAAGADRAIIVGGAAAVQPTVATQVASLVSASDRIDGTDRYDTSANFSQWAVDNALADWASVGVATGEKFPDALAGGAGIGTRGGVVVLTPATTMHSSIAEKLGDVGSMVMSLEVFGGEGAVSADVYDALMALVNTP